jgi:hypothetical protein
LRALGPSHGAGGATVTVTTNECAVVLPALSVALQATVVAPSAKTAPLAGTQLTGSVPSTTSVAVKEYVTATPPLVGAVRLRSLTENTGGVVSTTRMVNAPEAVAPRESVTVQTRSVAPIGKVEPEADWQSGTSVPSSTSWPEEVKATTAPPSVLPSTVMSAGTWMAGGCSAR